ncbi:2-amino-4-hydroxy-6-hydroxymethyldihydropteridine diphosphokinase [Snuella sedimenti]|uniref:2-amino-4-hydroxy-6-hydroxymethyldihydropteridine pyrophosphokinase n=1 Tax=Snuella sedimenti TaxID=2798802 RepID=A0A8J7II87_9FLAO|nr:2-amino-4-hydroxy-6-hydroxymethyldihydropteridine diphosphokinase [Snuella sedimenti]MBJ6369363.1 2-amino-4-hydroxy-6-hydroxymethyldihydropteridine diphosphokinase [Snuella sedimenti]
MKRSRTYYIALGSNKGDKLQNLQEAVEAIHLKIGMVITISKVYTSAAFGFEGDDFLNACLVLKSDLKPEEVLQELLVIEVSLGRVRTEGVEGYQARTVDLDIIFSEKDIISTDTLEVPHPEMSKRQFVLLPLHDVAPNMVHPILHKTVSELLASCGDTSVLEPISQNLNNPRDRYNLSKYKYIAIEGNIGAGKTSLATKIANDFNAKLILERFADNPFLPKFYEDAQRYAFPLEMSFLADRYQQIHEDMLQLDMFKDFIISDYDVFKSLIFSKITLPEDEFNLYRKLFDLMYKDLTKPDLYVFLHQSTSRLQENIKTRGRHYEQDIADDYLEKINAGYLDFLKNKKDVEVKIIDITDKDFVENRHDYLWVLGEIFS